MSEWKMQLITDSSDLYLCVESKQVSKTSRAIWQEQPGPLFSETKSDYCSETQCLSRVFAKARTSSRVQSDVTEAETTDHRCISHPSPFCQSHIKSHKVILLLPIYINKHQYHKPYSCQPQHSSALIVALCNRPQPPPPSHRTGKKNLRPASTTPQPPNHLQNSANRYGEIQKSLLNKTMAFVLFVFHWNKGGNYVAADISLLCKCSFPHKQRGVQNSRVERVESIVRACVLRVCSINSSQSLGQSVVHVCVALRFNCLTL